jgi:DNA-binding SARP family transcriptional activator/TolB-like protein
MIRLRALGSLDLRDESGKELRSVLAQPKRIALLAYLALAKPGNAHRRDTLLALFWPEQDSERARNALSQAIFFLRRELGEETILSHNGDSLRLDASRVWCDVTEFEQSLDAQKPLDAVDLYRGELLEGFHVGNAPEFERWVDSERERLGTRFGKTVEALASQREATGDLPGALVLWRRLATRDPYNSTVALRLMRALAASGDIAGTVKHARGHETLLRTELDIALPADVAAFLRDLQSQSSSQSPPSRAIPASSAPELHAPTVPLEPRQRTSARRTLGVAAAVVGFAAIAGFATMKTLRSPTPSIRSVAVLPFKDHSSDSTRPLFAHAMHDALITELARYPELDVKSRTSVEHYRTTDKRTPEIARELNADGVVEGAVQHDGSRVRVTIQLIHGSTDRHVWADTFTRDVWDRLAIHDDLAASIARQLRVAVTPRARPNETAAVPPPAAKQLHVMELYLRGKHNEIKRTPIGVQTAKEAYESAIREDSTFARGHAALSNLYSTIARYSYSDPRIARDSARAIALRAVALDSSLSEAHTALAISLADHLQWQAAEREFQTAIRLSPKDAQARYWYAMFLVVQGRGHDALREARLAYDLEPFPPRGLIVTLHSAEYLATGKRSFLSTPAGKRWTEFMKQEPGEPYSYRSDAFDLAVAGKCAEARKQAAIMNELAPDALQVLIAMSMIEWWCKDARRADQILDRAKRHPFANSQAVGIANAYVARNNLDSAFAWLDRMEWRFATIMDLRGVRFFDPIRSDSRYPALLKRLGLPVEVQR